MECDQCKHCFDSETHQPYTLYPCSHTYCIKCVNEMVDKKCIDCSQDIKNTCKNLALLNHVLKPVHEIECEICVQPYDHNKNRPVSLYPCPHTICVECFGKLERSKCPICKEVIQGSFICLINVYILF